MKVLECTAYYFKTQKQIMTWRYLWDYGLTRIEEISKDISYSALRMLKYVSFTPIHILKYLVSHTFTLMRNYNSWTTMKTLFLTLFNGPELNREYGCYNDTQTKAIIGKENKSLCDIFNRILWKIQNICVKLMIFALVYR